MVFASRNVVTICLSMTFITDTRFVYFYLLLSFLSGLNIEYFIIHTLIIIVRYRYCKKQQQTHHLQKACTKIVPYVTQIEILLRFHLFSMIRKRQILVRSTWERFIIYQYSIVHLKSTHFIFTIIWFIWIKWEGIIKRNRYCNIEYNQKRLHII